MPIDVKSVTHICVVPGPDSIQGLHILASKTIAGCMLASADHYSGQTFTRGSSVRRHSTAARGDPIGKVGARDPLVPGRHVVLVWPTDTGSADGRDAF